MRHSTFSASLTLTLIATFLIALAACTGNMESTGGGSGGTPVTLTVNILGNSMDPQSITVPAGSTVIFHNTTSADHGIISDLFDTNLAPGQDYQYTFTYAGVYVVSSRTHTNVPALRCEVHVE